jgi:hypothetical protein
LFLFYFKDGGLFEKTVFKNGEYDAYNLTDYNKNQVDHYSLRMALESKFLTLIEMRHLLQLEINKKK